ncbi:Ribonucleases P/MRP protein subunit POP1 [Paraburkholderia sabiae]|nr:Ribonucleases P/MRP protein subunit POP1 [Paraburkholderia sabiae]
MLRLRLFDNIGDAVLICPSGRDGVRASDGIARKGTPDAAKYAVARASRPRLESSSEGGRRRSEPRADHAKISVATPALLGFERRLAESSAHS